MIRRLLAACLLIVLAGPASAELRAFTGDSLEAIKRDFAGRPFILSLWSISCSHCLRDLPMLKQAAARGANLVLVSTDSLDDAEEIRAALRRAGLARGDSWVFADDVPERLRYAIDPDWHGELPRTYLYDRAHGREAVTGLLSRKQLEQWLQRR